jgi:hypothetical protein
MGQAYEAIRVCLSGVARQTNTVRALGEVGGRRWHEPLICQTYQPKGQIKPHERWHHCQARHAQDNAPATQGKGETRAMSIDEMACDECPNEALTLVTAEICVRVQPNSVLSGTTPTVSTAMAVAPLAKCMPATTAKTNQP